MKPSLLLTLYKLAETVALSNQVMHTTIGLAKRLNISQQTVSRHLILLEKEGYIRREKKTSGEIIMITGKGKRELREMHITLERILNPDRKQMILTGEVFSGLGEGAYYVSQLGYSGQFRKKLGFKPYPGTLNVRLDEDSVRKRGLLEGCPHVTIESFSSGTRTFGSVQCYKVMLNEMAEAYIITAYRTHYDSGVLEIISSGNLRKTLGVRDGDRITITVSLGIKRG